MVIKCKCGRETCGGQVYFSDSLLWFTNDKVLTTAGMPLELSIYLDANGLVGMTEERR